MALFEFSVIAPLLTHLFKTAGEAIISLNNIKVEVHLSIPTGPILLCDSASVVVSSLADVEGLFATARRGFLNVHTLSAKCESYSFKFTFQGGGGLGVIQAPEAVRQEFATLFANIPESNLIVVN
jgi:hypothetical protein